MERGSDKHNPMIDDEMKRETASFVRGAPVDSRVEEHRQYEAPADGEPVPDAVLFMPGRHSDKTLSGDETELRTMIAQNVRPHVFPATRDGLVSEARENNAPAGVVGVLTLLPPTRRFENVQQVWEALGGTVERRS